MKLTTTLAILVAALTLYSCDDVYELETFSVEQIVVEKGYEREASLEHHWDSVSKTHISDVMTATMQIRYIADGVKNVVYDDIFYPQLTAQSVLLWDKDTIDMQLLNAPVKKSYIHRKGWNTEKEEDTVYVELTDGQKIWYPVKVTNKIVKIGNTNYGFGSLSLVKALYMGATNQQIDATKDVTVYNTVYKTVLTFEEKFVDNPKTFNVPVYAFATRSVLKESTTPSFTVSVHQKQRTAIDASTELVKFTEVFTYNTGNVESVEISKVLHRRFEGSTFQAKTFNFGYKRAGSNGILKGEESLIEESGNWKVFGRTDIYSAPFENGTTLDTINSRYPLYHECAVYKDQYVEVIFGYQTFRIVELETKVEKPSDKPYTLHNSINVIYLGYEHLLDNTIELVFH